MGARVGAEATDGDTGVSCMGMIFSNSPGLECLVLWCLESWGCGYHPAPLQVPGNGIVLGPGKPGQEAAHVQGEGEPLSRVLQDFFLS